MKQDKTTISVKDLMLYGSIELTAKYKTKDMIIAWNYLNNFSFGPDGKQAEKIYRELEIQWVNLFLSRLENTMNYEEAFHLLTFPIKNMKKFSYLYSEVLRRMLYFSEGDAKKNATIFNLALDDDYGIKKLAFQAHQKP